MCTYTLHKPVYMLRSKNVYQHDIVMLYICMYIYLEHSYIYLTYKYV